MFIIIEETVLRRQRGTRETMAEQLQYLTTAEATVQILPADADTNRQYDGSFALATVDGAEVGYVDTPARGYVVDPTEVVSAMRQRWEIIAAESLPRRQSKELILEVAGQWTQ